VGRDKGGYHGQPDGIFIAVEQSCNFLAPGCQAKHLLPVLCLRHSGTGLLSFAWGWFRGEGQARGSAAWADAQFKCIQNEGSEKS